MKTSLTKTTETEATSVTGTDEIIEAKSVTTGSALVPTSTEGLVGDFDQSDISFPRMQIAQGVGPLSDSHSKGDIVLDGATVIGGPNMDPLDITVVRIAKMFEEDLPFGGEEVPRIVETRDQVTELGWTTEWINNERPSWKPVAEALVCIKGDDANDFPYSHKKDNYAFALWKIKGVAYRRAAVPIFTAATMYYRDGLRNGSFQLTTEKQVFSGNTVFCPKVTRGERHAKGFVDWLAEFA